MSSRSFQLAIHCDLGRPFAPALRRFIRRANSLLPTPLKELSVALVGDAAMAQLHQRYLNIPGPTDVLTFPPADEANGGEIVICVPEARRQAKMRGIEPRDEIILYVLHGMLHLCGMDDRTRRGFEAMHRMEDQILIQLRVARSSCAPIRKPHQNLTRKGVR